ncbi:Zinc finger, CW-type [Parasponia andersonii]|uniref:Zinc finger, CW-type n=1 Tax=Parasponia andersonii TaxID=3476 RepID=A0A2P5B7Q8_PARAD|nr:Zinc finger, CW-type [Parasponia andersonii]
MLWFLHKLLIPDQLLFFQSLNEGKHNLEIPIVSYRRQGQVMEVDTSAQSEALAKYNLKAIKEFSPFNKYLISEKAGLFHERTGTQIYIWNLDEWGSDYSLEWCDELHTGSSSCQGDIYIRFRRTRSRPGQISQKVLLDYSLQSYLEVLFLVPRMKIYVQGSLVKSQPLAKSLNKTVVETGNIMGKRIPLALGRSQLEWERANCGIFLYWHGRLIEAYKRVSGMIHNADMGRGVVGVIDVTDLMNDEKGGVWVLNNKQGFQDYASYAHLERWLSHTADKYWDENFDEVQMKRRNDLYKPDQEWVQCDKCRKWRMLSCDFDSKNLPLEWVERQAPSSSYNSLRPLTGLYFSLMKIVMNRFCYMKPFEQCCEIPEQKIASGVITVSAKRSGYDYSVSIISGGDTKDSYKSIEEVSSSSIEGMRKRFPRACKKAR